MSGHESDSSGPDDTDYTETNVLLGYASREPTEDTISHLGGQPTWLDPDHPPSAALAQCKVCRDMMRLLLQLNGDLPERFPGHERRLYVFGCSRKTCKRKEGSIRAIRGTRVDMKQAKKVTGDGTRDGRDQEEEEQDKKKVGVEARNLGQDLFGSSSTSSTKSPPSNPFSSVTSTSTSANPFDSSSSFPPLSTLAAKPAQNPFSSDLAESFAAKVSLNTPAFSKRSTPPDEFLPWPSPDKLPTPYPLYYLEADYETLDAPPLPAIPSIPIIDDDDHQNASIAPRGNKKEDAQAFESHHDKTFQRFADRLAQNPLQVIRYEFNGAPLLASRSDPIGRSSLLHPSFSAALPRCPNCTAPRVFEVQITPHAIAELEVDLDLDDDDSNRLLLEEGMEWSTVLLAVCQMDCCFPPPPPPPPPSISSASSSSSPGPQEDTYYVTAYTEEWIGVQWEEPSRLGGK